uniref:Uncharacterized protein n=1 Tax=Sparus aurata TaxID=8175 RepID=A0A671WQG5_SPAAU
MQLWFCLRPTKAAHTCVHGAQDADILPRLSLVHSQSRNSQQLRLQFHGGGTPVFVCPWCQPRQNILNQLDENPNILFPPVF